MLVESTGWHGVAPYSYGEYMKTILAVFIITMLAANIAEACRSVLICSSGVDDCEVVIICED